MRGFFIAIEGIDGCGKSTQCERLAAWAIEKAVSVFQPTDPGTTDAGKLIREILLMRKDVPLHPRTQAALFAAARCELAHSYIHSCLRAGNLVVSDRWTTSTVVYQHYGAVGTKAKVLGPAGGMISEVAKPLSPHQIEMICNTLVDGIDPDLTLILDLPVEEAQGRIPVARRDRFESMGRDFHDRLRDGYLAVAGRPGYAVVNVEGMTSDEVFDLVRTKIQHEAERQGEASCLWRLRDETKGSRGTQVGDRAIGEGSSTS